MRHAAIFLVLLLVAGATVAQRQDGFTVEELTPAEQKSFNEAAKDLADSQRRYDASLNAIKQSHGQTQTYSTNTLGCTATFTGVEIKGKYALITTNTVYLCGGM